MSTKTQTTKTDTAQSADQKLLAQATSEISSAWKACQKPNIAFGKACCKWRDRFGAQGSRSGEGLAQILRKLNIGEGVAYYWMAKAEGKEPAKKKPSASVSAPAPSERTFTDDELRMEVPSADHPAQLISRGP